MLGFGDIVFQLSVVFFIFLKGWVQKVFGIKKILSSVGFVSAADKALVCALACGDLVPKR